MSVLIRSLLVARTHLAISNRLISTSKLTRVPTSCYGHQRPISSLQKIVNIQINVVYSMSTRSKRIRKFKPKYAKDKVNMEWSLIYENGMNRMLFWGQAFVYTTMLPLLVWNTTTLVNNKDWDLSIHHPASVALVYAVFGSLLVGFMNAASRRSIFRMYADPASSKRIAIVQNWAMVPRQLEFTVESVVANTPKITKPMSGNMIINGRPFYVFGADFVLPKYFNELQGWHHEKPLDRQSDLNLKDFLQNSDDDKK